VLEAAGGQVLAEDGAPLRYGKPGWRNSGFVATGLPGVGG
jgi:3'(2'), 5'-bisphosphate nucleotidase